MSSNHSEQRPLTNGDRLSAKPERYPLTGISVLVVGAGVGGIMTALECWRNGHDVRILERSSGPVGTGDFFTIGFSAVKAFRNWPQLAKENEELAYDPWIAFYKHTGEMVLPPGPMSWDAGAAEVKDRPKRIYRHHRPKVYRMLLAQLERLGVQPEFGQRAIDYYEDSTTGKGGVVLDNGSRLEADVVVAADGLGTKSFSLVVGRKVAARSSGYAIFRTAYPVEYALADPQVAERFKLLDNGQSVNEIWMGPDMHMFVWRSKDLMSWLITHKDNGLATESWQDSTKIEDVLKYTATVPGWPEIMNRTIRTTPKDGIIDWKLMWRDPQPQWASPRGRVLQLGDAAHTFIPSSGNGATQAIEDAVSLATCLRLGGEDNVPDAVKVHVKLRYDRVSCCQKIGFANQETYHNADRAAAVTNASGLKPKHGSWIWKHDPEQYALENYEKVVHCLETGEEWMNTNIPPGYKPRPWSIDELSVLKEQGKPIELDGDWS
ncbi:hypothetical protein MMC11_009079 [Xylographa trunciseda]|nr:hypothetical protein [Xylographa trunciseda]